MADKVEAEEVKQTVDEEANDISQKSDDLSDKDSEVPPEVDAFLKGKRKYKHPYGDWRPVANTEAIKRKNMAEVLDLPSDNWYLTENQPEPVITETKDQTAKITFKERETPDLTVASSSKSGATVTFKKRKTVNNRQIRGSDDTNSHRKD